MATRDYFSLTYAVPGFVFTLVVAGLNFSPILTILSNTQIGSQQIGDFGIVLSFLSLFASSAVGFLVSQLWFTYFHLRKVYVSVLSDVFEDMKAVFGWKQNAKDNIEKTITVLDYMLMTEATDHNWNFAQRKWDIFGLLSCTMYALGFGAIAGISLRFTFEWTFNGKLPLEIFSLSTIQSKTDNILFWLTIASVFVFIVILYFGRSRVFREYIPMLRILIRAKAKDTKTGFISTLEETFPENFEKAQQVKKSIQPSIIRSDSMPDAPQTIVAPEQDDRQSNDSAQEQAVQYLVDLVDSKFEKSLRKIYFSRKLDFRYFSGFVAIAYYAILMGLTGYLLVIISQALPAGLFQQPPNVQIPIHISFVAAFIAFASFGINVQKIVEPIKPSEVLFAYNYRMLKDETAAKNPGLFKALLIMKSKQPDLNLKENIELPISKEKLFSLLYKSE